MKHVASCSGGRDKKERSQHHTCLNYQYKSTNTDVIHWNKNVQMLTLTRLEGARVAATVMGARTVLSFLDLLVQNYKH